MFFTCFWINFAANFLPFSGLGILGTSLGTVQDRTSSLGRFSNNKKIDFLSKTTWAYAKKILQFFSETTQATTFYTIPKMNILAVMALTLKNDQNQCRSPPGRGKK